jgi:hypothetical protein
MEYEELNKMTFKRIAKIDNVYSSLILYAFLIYNNHIFQGIKYYYGVDYHHVSERFIESDKIKNEDYQFFIKHLKD